MNKFRIILLGMLLWGIENVIANDEVQKLVISKKNGTEVAFLVSEMPIIKFPKYSPNHMTIKTIDREVKLWASDLDKMVIVHVNIDGIFDITNNKDASFKMEGDALLVEVLSGEASLAVYDVNGSLFFTKKFDLGKYAFPLTHLPKGMCLIKINDETYKILNR